MSESQKYILYGTEFKANPFPTYQQMRQEAPIAYHQAWSDGHKVWFITHYDDVNLVLRDHKRFVKDYLNTLTPEERGQKKLDSDLFNAINNHMLNKDGTDHLRLRTLVNKAFSARRMKHMPERVQVIAEHLLDLVQDQGQMDLIGDYAFPVSIVVIAELLGIPPEDRDRFRVWTGAFMSPVFSEAEAEEARRLLQEFVDYLCSIFEERRKHPQADIITALVQAEAAGDKLNEDELCSMVILLIVAGHETTVNLIGNGILALLQHPDQLDKLKQEPSLIENAVEEFLRYDGPAERATLRFAAEDVELGGHLIRRGEAVSVVLASANRDSSQFDHPDELDITRENNRHLGFGMGVHYCVGAPLARIEGQVAINTLLRRMPNLQLVVPIEELTWGIVPLIRGLNQMPVTW